MKTKEYKLCSELEMEMIINRYKSLARKRQIALQILDNEIPYYPTDIRSYMTSSNRKNMLKLGIEYLRQFLP